MLEYAVSSAMQRELDTRYPGLFLMTFAVSHEYPDFYLRTPGRSVLLRIEMKAVDAESDEQAARFSTATQDIDPFRDVLLLVAWEWTSLLSDEGDAFAEYPHIFASLVVSASAIAVERDYRLAATGGKIVLGNVFVFSKKKNDYVPDPNNYGKFWRIIRRDRHGSSDLSAAAQRFTAFLEAVNGKAPRSRIGATRQTREDDA